MIINNKYKVSVVIPFFNPKKTIQKSIESVVRQSLDEVQIVLIDDGSTDDTNQIVDEYEANDNAVIIHQTNKGVSCARNVGIEEATGKYIFFLDSDDYLEPDALQIMYEYSEDNGLDLVACSHTEFNATIYQGNDSRSKSFTAYSREEIAIRYPDIFPQSVWGKLFVRQILVERKIRFDEEMTLGEDQFFTQSYLLEISSMGKSADAFLRIQNVNPLSLSKRYVPSYSKDVVRQIELWDKLLLKYPSIENSYYREKYDFKLSLSAGVFNNLYKQDCPLSRKEKSSEIVHYLKEHGDWIRQGGNGIRGGKNAFQRLTITVLKTQSPMIIGCFFGLKEMIKKRKFEGGRRDE